MTIEELKVLVEDEIMSCLGHIRRGESVIFYEGKLSGLTLMREKLSLIKTHEADFGGVRARYNEQRKEDK